MIDEGADDTGTADDVLIAHLITHIVEATEGDRLLVDTLLQESEPEVAALILGDGVDLAAREVHLHAEEGVVEHMVVLGFVDGDTLTIVANDDAAEVVAEEGRYGVAVGALDMDEVGALETEHARITGAHVDGALMVFAEIAEEEVGAIGQIALHILTIIAQESLAIGDEPQTALLVFDEGVDGMQIGQRTAHLLGMGLILELHDAQA